MSKHLEEQAASLGIDLGFHDIGGIYHATKPEVLEGIVKALQQDGFSDDLYTDTLVAHERADNAFVQPAFATELGHRGFYRFAGFDGVCGG